MGIGCLVNIRPSYVLSWVPALSSFITRPALVSGMDTSQSSLMRQVFAAKGTMHPPVPTMGQGPVHLECRMYFQVGW
jgi:hypothetical protein